MRRKALILSITLFALSIAACAAPEVLLPKSGVIPAGVDFSGRWALQDPGRESIRRIDEATAEIPDDILKEAQRARTGRQSRSSKGTAVHVFLETGTNLKITQTEFGIFVSFDRSTVEEYRFGENRVVSVGPINAARVSGWDGNDYVIETLDEDGAKLVERYRLEDNNNTLVRQVILWVKDEQTLDIELIFDRV
jgi:hypothetical protein